MNAADLLLELLESEITPTLTQDGTGIVVPAGRLTVSQRAAILAHREELIARIQRSLVHARDLVGAAMLACDVSDAASERIRKSDLRISHRQNGISWNRLNSAYVDRSGTWREGRQ